MAGPSNPGGIYELDWETTPAVPPLPWKLQSAQPGRVAIAHLANGAPVRAGAKSVRFELHDGDIWNGSSRSELAATPDEPVAAAPQPPTERWYGFSIYLEPPWAVSANAESVAQWHQSDNAPDKGSPPLAIATDNGGWSIVMRNWTINDTKSWSVANYAADVGKWTDWVVHVKWSRMQNDAQASVRIWKDGLEVFRWEPGTPEYQATGQQNCFIDTNQNPHKAYGNYMKIGIYKWCWNAAPPIGCKAEVASPPKVRILYHDELRIADQSGSYAAVAPRVHLYRYWNPQLHNHFYTTDWNVFGSGHSGWIYERVQCRVIAAPPNSGGPAPHPGFVPLFRYLNGSNNDYFYTIDWNELRNGSNGWVFERIECYVLVTKHNGSTQLYRYWNPGSTRVILMGSAAGWIPSGWLASVLGSFPALFQRSNGDHFYTTDWNELGAGNYGWAFERIECYVFTA